MLSYEPMHSTPSFITELNGSFTRVALISDTHGLLRPELVTALSGADLILHAGDVGDPGILDQLKTIAPTWAVRGNVDIQASLADLPGQLNLSIEGRLIAIGHERMLVNLDGLGDVGMVMYGHTHKPLVEEVDGVLYVNPGSVGPKRFRLPVSFAWLCIHKGKWDVSLHELAV